jgi:uncharacterized protein YraI
MGLAFVMALNAAVCAGAATSAPATAPGTMPAVPMAAPAPATAPAVSVPVPVVPSSAPAKSVAKKIVKAKKKSKIKVTAFIGQINATHVNIRSGPGLSYYTMGQLARGDLVKVTGERNGWYRIAAPAGARCYIARQFVKLGADGTTGTVTGSFVNVRAASALTPASNYAVVDVLNTGSSVSVTGQTPAYDIIRAPKGTGVYILARFVSPAPAGSTYVTPELKMPAGFKGTGLPTGSTPAATPATPAVAANTSGASATGLSAPVAPVTTGPAIDSAGSAVVPVPAPATAPAASSAPVAKTVNMPAAPVPAANYNPSVFDTFTALNRQLQAQFNKPVMQRDLKPLLSGFEHLLQRPNLPHYISDGCAARIKLVKKQLAIQEIVAASHQQKPITAVLAPYQQKWKQAQKELEKVQAKAPYIAYGVLKTSTVLRNYALMDPVTGRVVAYLQPESQINISKLLGSYIGVKGEVVSRTGVVVRVIKVTSATMFPEPSAQGSANP